MTAAASAFAAVGAAHTAGALFLCPVNVGSGQGYNNQNHQGYNNIIHNLSHQNGGLGLRSLVSLAD